MQASKITVYGADWCGDCRRARRYLVQNHIEFEWINIEEDKQGEQFVLKVNQGMRSIPTIIFEDGSILVEPSNRQLAQKFDLPVR